MNNKNKTTPVSAVNKFCRTADECYSRNYGAERNVSKNIYVTNLNDAKLYFVGVGLGNGLSPVRRQAIVWTDFMPTHGQLDL